MRLYIDADFADDGTNGAVSGLYGKVRRTWILVAWFAKTQRATTGSTADAETTAVDDGRSPMSVPLQTMLEQVVNNLEVGAPRGTLLLDTV